MQHTSIDIFHFTTPALQAVSRLTILDAGVLYGCIWAVCWVKITVCVHQTLLATPLIRHNIFNTHVAHNYVQIMLYFMSIVEISHLTSSIYDSIGQSWPPTVQDRWLSWHMGLTIAGMAKLERSTLTSNDLSLRRIVLQKKYSLRWWSKRCWQCLLNLNRSLNVLCEM